MAPMAFLDNRWHDKCTTQVHGRPAAGRGAEHLTGLQEVPLQAVQLETAISLAERTPAAMGRSCFSKAAWMP